MPARCFTSRSSALSASPRTSRRKLRAADHRLPDGARSSAGKPTDQGRSGQQRPNRAVSGGKGQDHEQRLRARQSSAPRAHRGRGDPAAVRRHHPVTHSRQPVRRLPLASGPFGQREPRHSSSPQTRASRRSRGRTSRPPRADRLRQAPERGPQHPAIERHGMDARTHRLGLGQPAHGPGPAPLPHGAQLPPSAPFLAPRARAATCGSTFRPSAGARPAGTRS